MMLIILFYSSLVGILALFSLKALEKRQGKVYAGEWREKSDALLETAILRCVREYRRHDKERIFALARQGFVHLRRWFLHAKSVAEQYRKKVLARIEGRRDPRRASSVPIHTAPVSFFLKQVSDYKNGNGHLKSEEKPPEETPLA